MLPGVLLSVFSGVDWNQDLIYASTVRGPMPSTHWQGLCIVWEMVQFQPQIEYKSYNLIEALLNSKDCKKNKKNQSRILSYILIMERKWERKVGRKQKRGEIITNVASNTTIAIPGELLIKRSKTPLKINCQSRLKTEKENLAIYMWLYIHDIQIE